MAATSVVSVVAVHHRNAGFHYIVPEILRQSFRMETNQCVGTVLDSKTGISCSIRWLELAKDMSATCVDIRNLTSNKSLSIHFVCRFRISFWTDL